MSIVQNAINGHAPRLARVDSGHHKTPEGHVGAGGRDEAGDDVEQGDARLPSREEFRRSILIRAIERFDQAVEVVEGLWSRRPDQVRDRASYESWGVMFELAKEDCREMESALADLL